MAPLLILLIEDNPDHALIIRRGLERNRLLNEVRVISDGKQALDYLLGRGEFSPPDEPQLPGLILLDIKLPRVDGFEVLQRIKDDPELRSIPVIMLTSSEQEKDIARCYARGANSYITKPIRFERFIQTVADLELYWFLVNKLPPQAAQASG